MFPNPMLKGFPNRKEVPVSSFSSLCLNLISGWPTLVLRGGLCEQGAATAGTVLRNETDFLFGHPLPFREGGGGLGNSVKRRYRYSEEVNLPDANLRHSLLRSGVRFRLQPASLPGEPVEEQLPPPELT
jgi:hypothetical protein